jgi:glycosyltransferase involved in cell wall biosynthesis
LIRKFKNRLLKKIAIITTHPIQYNAPFFKLLAQSKIVQIKVFYTWGDTVLQSKFDPGFKKNIEWDIPLLDGYEYEFLDNIAKKKGSEHYKGINNPHILSKIHTWKPDAILVYGWKFRSHLKVIRHFKNKIPIWFRGDSTLLDEKKSIKSIFKNVLLKWVYKHIDIALYAGTNNKKYFLQNGLKPHQLIKAFHAIDNERFQNTGGRYSSPAKEWKDKLEVNPRAVVFLFAGKLEPKKGIETLLQAFKQLSKKQAHLVIVGNGPDEDRLKKRYGNESKVTSLDFQNQLMMPVVYQLCDVFILPSKGPGESWGLSMNEAMAAGKAVIASDRCGGAVDLISNGENGFIFKAGNVNDLANCMNNFLGSEDQIKTMQEKSLQKVQQFTFDKFAAVIENLACNNE